MITDNLNQINLPTRDRVSHFSVSVWAIGTLMSQLKPNAFEICCCDRYCFRSIPVPSFVSPLTLLVPLTSVGHEFEFLSRFSEASLARVPTFLWVVCCCVTTTFVISQIFCSHLTTSLSHFSNDFFWSTVELYSYHRLSVSSPASSLTNYASHRCVGEILNEILSDCVSVLMIDFCFLSKIYDGGEISILIGYRKYHENHVSKGNSLNQPAASWVWSRISATRRPSVMFSEVIIVIPTSISEGKTLKRGIHLKYHRYIPPVWLVVRVISTASSPSTSSRSCLISAAIIRSEVWSNHPREEWRRRVHSIVAGWNPLTCLSMIHPTRIHPVACWCSNVLFLAITMRRVGRIAAAAWRRRRGFTFFLRFLFVVLVTEDAVVGTDTGDAERSLLLDVTRLNQLTLLLLVELAAEIECCEIFWRSTRVFAWIFRFDSIKQCFEKTDTFYFSFSFHQFLLLLVNLFS